jgi:hypothetical protein
MMEAAQWRGALLYVAATNVVGLGAAWAGYRIVALR